MHHFDAEAGDPSFKKTYKSFMPNVLLCNGMDDNTSDTMIV
jgi:hypothetical protein